MTHVVCLPGGVAPAAQRYSSLRAALGDAAELHLKDLEVYREDAPPPGYAVELELEAVDRFADELGLDRFHLLGYSGGGFLSLAYAGTRSARILSLALFEPASIPGRMSDEERAHHDTLQEKLRGLSGAEFMAAFAREQVKPGVQLPPPPSSPPPGMQKRPAGLAALMEVFTSYDFDRDRFRAARFPVYLGYGDLTSDVEAVRAGLLAQLFSDIHVQRHAGVHHFMLPEQIYTPRHVNALRELWSAAELSLQE